MCRVSHFHADSLSVIRFRIYCLSCEIHFERWHTALHFQHGLERGGDRLCFLVLCFQRDLGVLTLFSSWLFSHHFSNLSVKCQRVMKNRRERMNEISHLLKLNDPSFICSHLSWIMRNEAIKPNDVMRVMYICLPQKCWLHIFCMLLHFACFYFHITGSIQLSVTSYSPVHVSFKQIAVCLVNVQHKQITVFSILFIRCNWSRVIRSVTNREKSSRVYQSSEKRREML